MKTNTDTALETETLKLILLKIDDVNPQGFLPIGDVNITINASLTHCFFEVNNKGEYSATYTLKNAICGVNNNSREDGVNL